MLRYWSMTAVNFKAIKDGHGYVTTELVPANHTEARGADKWGMVVAGSLLLLTASFVCLLILTV